MPRAKIKPTRDDLDNLTRTQLQNITKAFDNACKVAYGSPYKKRKLEAGGFLPSGAGGFLPQPNQEYSAGGFILEDGSEDVQMGGFMADEESQPVEEKYDRLPLSHVDTALEELDIPFDAEIMAVFQQGAESDSEDEENQEAGTISKDKFLQVCAILIGGENSQDEGQGLDEQDAVSDGNPTDSEVEDDYANGSGSDDAHDTPARKIRTRAKAKLDKGKGKAFPSDQEELLTDIEEDETNVIASSKKQEVTPAPAKSKKKTKKQMAPLSNAQKSAVSLMFQSFFPEDNQAKSDSKTIGMENIKHVLTLIQKTMTDAEITEMLEHATTNPSLRVNLAEFEQIMRE